MSETFSPESRVLAKAQIAAQLYSQVGGDPAAEQLLAEIELNAEFEVRRHLRIEMSWADGLKYITGESRLSRAEVEFGAWTKRNQFAGCRILTNPPILRGVADWYDHGFTRGELEHLKKIFESSCIPQKPRKRADVQRIFGIKETHLFIT